MPHRSPTTARWELALRLKLARERRGLPLKDVAAALRVSSAFWSAIENDKRPLPEGRLAEVLDFFDFETEERHRVNELWQASRQPAWWQGYADVYDESALRFYGLEDGASRIRCYESNVVSGLLQTEHYVNEAIQGHPGNAPATVARRGEVRRRRQRLLWEPDPPQVTVVLNETALHQIVGSHKVLMEQIEHLIDLVGDLEQSLEIRILPFSAPIRSLACAGTLVLLSFDDHEILPTVGFAETLSHSAMVSGVDTFYEFCFNQALEFSLGREASLAFLQDRLETMRSETR